MTWLTEWKAISGRIAGLLEAGRFCIQCMTIKATDEYGAWKRELMPHSEQIFVELREFEKRHGPVLPAAGRARLERFLDANGGRFIGDLSGLPGLQFRLSALASLRAEIDYAFSDQSAVARRLSEQAFVHLQRSIVADPNVRENWIQAFGLGETACERLGAVHLLLHGIWAFKVDARGERTDLVIGEPLHDLTEAQSSAQALVLTEWKVIRNPDETPGRLADARRQAGLYSAGALAGFELATTRYIVAVSEDRLQLSGVEEAGILYRQVNIAVNPSTPSRS